VWEWHSFPSASTTIPVDVLVYTKDNNTWFKLESQAWALP
jgi:hypothetical protein